MTDSALPRVGRRWQGPITMNGALSYMDKPATAHAGRHGPGGRRGIG